MAWPYPTRLCQRPDSGRDLAVCGCKLIQLVGTPQSPNKQTKPVRDPTLTLILTRDPPPDPSPSPHPDPDPPPRSVADAETDSLTAESGFEEPEVTSAGVEVTRFVSRFVDKVCTEGHVTQEHVR